MFFCLLTPSSDSVYDGGSRLTGRHRLGVLSSVYKSEYGHQDMTKEGRLNIYANLMSNVSLDFACLVPGRHTQVVVAHASGNPVVSCHDVSESSIRRNPTPAPTPTVEVQNVRNESGSEQ